MNKILMSNDKNIIVDESETRLELSGEQTITIFNEEITDLLVTAERNARVVINDFRLLKESKTRIEFVALENASIVYNHAFINTGNYELALEAQMAANGSIAINIRGINDAGNTNIKIDGMIGSKKYDTNLMQSVKLININGGKASALPNMFVNNSRVSAEHNVTIGKVSQVELNYLMSKGISEAAAKKLILNGFLLNIFTANDFITKMKELINGR